MFLLRIYRHLYAENPRETKWLTLLLLIFVLHWTGLLSPLLGWFREVLIEALTPHH